jgi:hypothetical protein
MMRLISISKSVLLCFAFLAFSAEASLAQYVDSKLDRYGNFSCVSSESGGKECSISSDRLTSIVSTPCTEAGLENLSEGICSEMNFDPAIIREIAAIHPRFAATLAKLRGMTAAQASHARIYWVPIEITLEDIEQWLGSELESAPFLRKLHTRVQQASKRGPVKPLAYELTCEVNPDSTQATLKLQVIKEGADSQYSSLELALVSNQDKKWKVKDWRIKKNNEELNSRLDTK